MPDGEGNFRVSDTDEAADGLGRGREPSTANQVPGSTDNRLGVFLDAQTLSL